MKTNATKFVVIRGKFLYGDKDVENPDIIFREYQGESTLLGDTPQVTIFDKGETNLTNFLKASVETGKIITINRVVVDNLDDLFSSKAVLTEWIENRPRTTSVTGTFKMEDDKILIDNRNIHNIILDRGGLKYEYMYIEIYIYE